MEPLRIAHVTAELTPFLKVGGLADVSAALVAHLHRAGHDVRAFLPLHVRIPWDDYGLRPVPEVQNVPITIGGTVDHFSLMTAPLPGSGAPLYFVHCPAAWHRPGLYTNDPDEHRRFLLLSRAALESCQRLGWSPQILHGHDWPAGPLALYRKTVYAWDRLFQATRTVFTIHNLGYQGIFGSGILKDLNPVGSEYFDGEDLRENRVSFLKLALAHSDHLTTVSPTYAQEIQLDDQGMGLAGLLRQRAADLEGILNGVDYSEWNPATDRHIPHHFTARDRRGKARNKTALLQELGLRPTATAPLIGVVSRLAHQKGLDLLWEPLPELLRQRDIRFVLLGSGEPAWEEFFRGLQADFPGQVAFWCGHHEGLAHRIEAASDLFLMPSRYEPCGLNQMYSLRYGTVPVVRKTGGLADTVQHFDPATGAGNGIVFEHFVGDALRWAFDQALTLYANQPAWRRIVANGMAADFSWEVQGRRYEEMYHRVLSSGR